MKTKPRGGKVYEIRDAKTFEGLGSEEAGSVDEAFEKHWRKVSTPLPERFSRAFAAARNI